MYIVVVEDDKLQYEWLDPLLRQSKTLNVTRLERIKTEKEFYDKFEEIASDPPDVILLDIMLRWADPAPDFTPPPPEIDRDAGFFRAGLRCEQKLAADDRTKNIPIIIYSVLESEDLGRDRPDRPNVKFLEKDFQVRAIEAAIREMTDPELEEIHLSR
jgi:CheY-like chemotaxis protein